MEFLQATSEIRSFTSGRMDVAGIMEMIMEYRTIQGQIR
jgi:hypothetical protein